MADLSLTARKNEVWVAESPQDGVAGEKYSFVMTVPYVTAISSGVNTVYKDRTDLSTALFGSTTAAVSGNVFTSSYLTLSTGLAGRYVVNLQFKHGTSNVEIKKLLLRVDKQAYTP
jgi:hypothetical protein